MEFGLAVIKLMEFYWNSTILGADDSLDRFTKIPNVLPSVLEILQTCAIKRMADSDFVVIEPIWNNSDNNVFFFNGQITFPKRYLVQIQKKFSILLHLVD